MSSRLRPTAKSLASNGKVTVSMKNLLHWMRCKHLLKLFESSQRLEHTTLLFHSADACKTLNFCTLLYHRAAHEDATLARATAVAAQQHAQAEAERLKVELSATRCRLARGAAQLAASDGDETAAASARANASVSKVKRIVQQLEVCCFPFVHWPCLEYLPEFLVNLLWKCSMSLGFERRHLLLLSVKRRSKAVEGSAAFNWRFNVPLPGLL